MPFNVEMPDGTIIEDVPDGTTKEQVFEKWKSRSETIPKQEFFGTPKRDKSFFNQATEAAATVLGAPVDIVTAAVNVPLHAGGFQEIRNPVLGSEYLKSQIEQERLVPPEVRATAGARLSPAGKEQAIRDYLGPGNYRADPQGRITHVRDDRGAMVPYDEGLYDWSGVLTESSGPVLTASTAPYTSASPSGRAAMQGAGMAVSSTARHGLSALSGEEIPIMDRVRDILTKTVGTAATGYAFEKAGQGFDYLANLRNRAYGKAMESPVAYERTQSFQRQGVPSSIAQETGTPAHTSLEMSAAKSVHGQRIAQDLRNAQIDAIESRANQVMSKLSPKSGSPEAVTAALTHTHKTAIEGMKSARRSAWEQSWKKINDTSGNREIVYPTNLVDELNKIKSEQTSPLMGQEAAGIVSEINKRLDTAFKTSRPAKIDLQNIDIANIPSQEAVTSVRGLKSKDIQNILHDLSKESYGTGKMLESGKVGLDKALASRLRNAFEKDIAATDDPVIGMIQNTREAYRQASGKIDHIGRSVIGKLVNVEGKADVDAVTIAERLNTMRPSQVKALVKTLDIHNPSVTNQVRRYYLETAMEKAHKLPSGAVSESRDFSEQAFLSSLPKGRTFDLVYGNTVSKQDVLDVANIVQRLQELKHAGTGKSLTQEIRDVGGTVTGLAMGKMESAIFAMRSAADFIVPKNTARMMMTPEGKKAFLKLRGLKPGTPAYYNALTNLAEKYKEIGSIPEETQEEQVQE